MRRGEVWRVDLDPARGREANKVRLCVIVSSNATNIAADRLKGGVVTVVPFTRSAMSD